MPKKKVGRPKKKVKKSVVAKKKVAKKKVTKKVVAKPKVQDHKYWAKRKLNDKEMDWNYGESTWLEGYEKSVAHEHRDQILEVLKELQPFGGVLEMGCGVAPNLIRISEAYPENQMAGYDVNEPALERAKELLPKAIFKKGLHTEIPFSDKFDVVIADATLIYVPPKELDKVADEIDRVCKKFVILVERYAKESKVVSHVWGHNYKNLLEDRGFEVEERELKWESSKGWTKYGKLFIARRA